MNELKILHSIPKMKN